MSGPLKLNKWWEILEALTMTPPNDTLFLFCLVEGAKELFWFCFHHSSVFICSFTTNMVSN